jgi:hypothetical protein
LVKFPETEGGAESECVGVMLGCSASWPVSVGRDADVELFLSLAGQAFLPGCF